MAVKIGKAISRILVVIVILIAALMIGPRLFGIQIYSVLSGSMEPEYPVGSLIYVKSTDPEELQIGDVITFRAGEETVVTHRIAEIKKDNNAPEHVGYETVQDASGVSALSDDLQFVTKGDANPSNDIGTVTPEMIIGKPVFRIPYLGYVSIYIQRPPGRYIAIAVAGGILLLALLPGLFAGNNSSKKEK